jgi:hypothetical protein
MKRFLVIALFACAGCGQMPQMPFLSQHGAASASQQQAPKQTTALSGGPSYALDGQDCNARANSRMGMYDRPDTYPISDQERRDAFQALYSACMREHNWQVAGPVHAPTNDATQLAALSPAAGGYGARGNTVTAGNTIISSSSVPGATILVIGGNGGASASQLSSLSPSSGGALPQNATVVMVQSGQQGAYGQPSYIQPSGPLPVAIPVPPPPMARASHAQAAPTASAAQSPKMTMAPVAPKQQAAYQPTQPPQAAMPPAAPPAMASYAPVQPPAPVRPLAAQPATGTLGAPSSHSSQGWTRAPAAQTAQNSDQQLESILDK